MHINLLLIPFLGLKIADYVCNTENVLKTFSLKIHYKKKYKYMIQTKKLLKD